jgi:hypothetical protein
VNSETVNKLIELDIQITKGKIEKADPSTIEALEAQFDSTFKSLSQTDVEAYQRSTEE